MARLRGRRRILQSSAGVAGAGPTDFSSTDASPDCRSSFRSSCRGTAGSVGSAGVLECRQGKRCPGEPGTGAGKALPDDEGCRVPLLRHGLQLIRSRSGWGTWHSLTRRRSRATVENRSAGNHRIQDRLREDWEEPVTSPDEQGGVHALGPSVSVVVISHNYADFLHAALGSALAQRYPVEVLVVDDGSTDGSRDVIASYSGRVRSLLKENGGNSSVVNVAVPATSGEIVMFLDADDVLHPDAAAEVAAAWRPDCAKVQFRLSLIDAAGNRRGVDPPFETPMPNGDVVPQMLATGRYVTPVLTGNAYRRAVLNQVLPIPEDHFRNTNDGYLNSVCPFYGHVVSLNRELGSYRLHGRNLWAFSAVIDLDGVRQRVKHDLVRQRYLAPVARQRGLELAADLPMQDPVHVFLRLVSLRRDPAGHPVIEDSTSRLLRAGLVATLRGPLAPDALQRLVLTVALSAVAVLPASSALRVCDAVLASRPRPAWLRRLARLARGRRGNPRAA